MSAAVWDDRPTGQDALHGVSLKDIVTHLQAEYGWEELARRVPVKCFQSNPSVSSSLKFLRRTDWARERVEEEYVRLSHRERQNPLIAALKAGASLDADSLSQTKRHQALAWALRHGVEADRLLELLAQLEDVNFWPDSEALPLLNQAIEQGADPAFVRELLRRGADVSDSRYWLPLLHTVDAEGQAYRTQTRAPSTAMLDLLLSHGADPQASDSRGHTALDIAYAYGLKAFVNKLS
ncbi:VF530 family DNA-binding protein [Deinococcus radiophilus]|uniref:DNA-binding protein VF530 n=1 Tax=Deinococcus radiophilus TaxID=32062 RepID=A0A3S0HYA6_9DEIO|nr:VF530 family DNA-binding protein [Deinococcus radiophilus]RTR21147.1 DNA-binding protein VF530 [Deinococcus radiophilus]UFA50230.1 VF530 family DNA-binding protein [Deinococcus radiophilus]